MERLKSEKGITLIALVITIIVMLILVVVTINIVKNGGLFGTARDAASDTQFEAEREELLGYKYGKWYNAAVNTLNLDELKNEFKDNANWKVEDNEIKTDENGDHYLVLINNKTGNKHKLYDNAELVSIKAETNQGGTESTEEDMIPGTYKSYANDDTMQFNIEFASDGTGTLKMIDNGNISNGVNNQFRYIYNKDTNEITMIVKNKESADLTSVNVNDLENINTENFGIIPASFNIKKDDSGNIINKYVAILVSGGSIFVDNLNILQEQESYPLTGYTYTIKEYYNGSEYDRGTITFSTEKIDGRTRGIWEKGSEKRCYIYYNNFLFGLCDTDNNVTWTNNYDTITEVDGNTTIVYTKQ